MSEIASKVQKIIVDKLGVEESEVCRLFGYCRTDHGIRKRIRYFYS